MSGKTLPAYLREVLENHVAQADIAYDDELKDIMQRLSDLNSNVENIKAKIRAKKASRGELE